MNILYTRFSQSIRWNILESIIYQGSLLMHQLILFKVTDTHFYGLMGTLFSTLYLLILVINFGLDVSIAPFFIECTQNKTYFKRNILPQFIPEIVLLLCIFIFFYLNIPLAIKKFPSLLQIDTLLLFVLVLILVCESLKKTMRTILQLAFLNHYTACVEIITIVSYITTIWIGYALGFPINLYTIFVPMFIGSITGLSLLMYRVRLWYQQLPDVSSTLPLKTQLPWRLLKNRFFNYLTQLSHVLFSGNFLIPLFAIQFRLNQAGIFKVISTITYSITVVIHRIFGLSSEALLAHMKNMHFAAKRDAFVLITNRLHQVLYGILIFFIINYNNIMNIYGDMNNTTMWLFMMLFVLIHVSEHFFLAYEKFYSVEERADYLLFFTLITIALLYITLVATLPLGPLVTLLAMIAVRLFSYICISTISAYTWQLCPSWKPDSYYIGASLLMSCIIFLILR